MKVDMSREAVTVRLRQVSQLRRLCLALGRATRPGTTSAASPLEQSAPDHGEREGR